MKRLLLIITFIFLYSSKPFGQTIKIGYVNLDSIVGLMSELKSVDLDTVGAYYINKVLVPKYDKLSKDYQAKMQQVAMLHNEKKESAKLVKEIETIRNELDNAEMYVKEVMESKQREFLEPVYKKARNAINIVAKRSAYTHVISSNVVIIGPAIDNIAREVIMELKIGR